MGRIQDILESPELDKEECLEKLKKYQKKIADYVFRGTLSERIPEIKEQITKLQDSILSLNGDLHARIKEECQAKEKQKQEEERLQFEERFSGLGSLEFIQALPHRTDLSSYDKAVQDSIYFYLYQIQNKETPGAVNRGDFNWGRTAFHDKNLSTSEQRLRATTRAYALLLFFFIHRAIGADDLASIALFTRKLEDVTLD